MTNRKLESREIGLDLGLLLFKNFLDTDYLHYGLFTDGLQPKITNIPVAQENYAQMLISMIPMNVKSILDVGCGSGRFAHTLIEKGYSVDCVSPESILTDYAEELLKNKSKIVKCPFQNYESKKRYDLVLFSESFQYIPIKSAVSNAIHHLHQNGYILISDFFKTDAPGKSPLGGGHSLKNWEGLYPEYPLELKLCKDITNETAYTIDVANQLSQNLLHPIWKLILQSLNQRYPRILKLLKWKFNPKLNKIEYKYFSGENNGDSFRKYKRYMVYLFQKV